MKDLGDLRYILGILVERDKNGIYLSQVTYIEKVLATFGMEECKHVVTPALDPPGTESPKLESDVPYKQAIGSLLYISTRTRPDIAYAVGVACQMHDPTEEDWIAVKQIFCYSPYRDFQSWHTKLGFSINPLGCSI